ncbi:AAA family ATPase [Acidicapsa ligni]|uniref:AAA family ATPase n=1 Tax=Acidicapsa ligni TaxID=542300 RepID=UPI0021DF7D5D|nr:AAA family ATPase [Acidicapsa ligni]
MLEFPPFRIDLDDQSLIFREDNGHESRISLTPKAFGVLSYLMRHAGRLVTHEELMDAVWPETFVQPEILSGYIRDLRSALGDNARDPKFIETVQRRGYRFIASVQEETPKPVHFAMASHQILVGRDAELSAIEDRFEAVLQGKRQLIFITGEPGIGKTTICLGLVERVARSNGDLDVAWGQCIEGYGGKDPYFPMFQAVGGLCRDAGEPVREILRTKAPTCMVQLSEFLTGEQRDEIQRDVIGATPGRMLREIVEALETIAANHPLILVIEDLQWADNPTIDVISALARSRQPAKILVIATYRPLDVLLADSPIRRLKEDLAAHSLCHELALEPLTEIEIVEYLFAVGAEPETSHPLASVLYRLSEGNPLFIVAALERAIERGSIVQEDDRLALKQPLAKMDLDTPKSLHGLVEAQIDQLGALEQQILEAASVAGPKFTAVLVGAACECDWRDADDVCHRLARGRHIIRPIESAELAETLSPTYEFVHLLYKEALYDRQSKGRRSERHRLIGEKLEELHSSRLGPIAAELAYHFERALDWSRTIRYLSLAAENSLDRYAPQQALDLLQRALDYVPQLPTSQRPEREIQILGRQASLYFALFDARCVEAHKYLADRAAAYGMAEVEIHALRGLAACLEWISSEKCLATVEQALTLSAKLGDPVIKAQVLMDWSVWRAWAGDWSSKTLADIHESFDTLRQIGEPQIIAPSSIAYGMIKWGCSEYRQAQHYIATGMKQLEEFSEEQNPYVSSAYQRAQFFLPASQLYLGDAGMALRQVTSFIEAAEKNGHAFPTMVLHLNRAWIHFFAMDFAGTLKAGEHLPSETGNFGSSSKFLLRSWLVLMGLAKEGLGLHEEALSHLSKARAEMEGHAIMLDWYLRLPLQAALTEVWISKEDVASAREESNLFLGTALSSAELTWRALAWETDARVSIAEKNYERARRSISEALRLVKEQEIPLASWRVYATAARLYREDYGLAARKALLKFADSFAADHPLRAIFLSARAAAEILSEGDAALLP